MQFFSVSLKAMCEYISKRSDLWFKLLSDAKCIFGRKVRVKEVGSLPKDINSPCDHRKIVRLQNQNKLSMNFKNRFIRVRNRIITSWHQHSLYIYPHVAFNIYMVFSFPQNFISPFQVVIRTCWMLTLRGSLWRSWVIHRCWDGCIIASIFFLRDDAVGSTSTRNLKMILKWRVLKMMRILSKMQWNQKVDLLFFPQLPEKKVCWFYELSSFT